MTDRHRPRGRLGSDPGWTWPTRSTRAAAVPRADRRRSGGARRLASTVLAALAIGFFASPASSALAPVPPAESRLLIQLSQSASSGIDAAYDTLDARRSRSPVVVDARPGVPGGPPLS